MKLRVPPERADLVPRPRLVARLRDLSRRKVTVVVAPTGYGKTTALVQWIAREERPVAWLALDRADNDPVRMWLHVLGALEGAAPRFGESITPALLGHGNLTERALPVLVNELTLLERQVVLVLDDFQALTSHPARGSVAFLIERMPETVRIVVAARSNPQLPLGRLRAQGEVGEIRSDELRFARPEIREQFRRSVGVELDDDELELLEEKTEGWPAGCYLAALSIRDRADRRPFLEQFAGSNRHVVDYLGSEVLATQPVDEQQFLRRTSILERLSGPVCDAVLERSDSAEILNRIEGSNLFLVRLDEDQSYRYHRLFAELLRFELRREEPDSIPALHRRAAEAYEQSGAIDEAFDHAIEASAPDLARDLVLRHWLALVRAGQHESIRLMFARLGQDAVEADAALALLGAWIAGFSGEPEDALEGWLRAAEAAPQAGPFPFGTGSVPLEAAVIRASFLFGDVGKYVTEARRLRTLGSHDPEEAIAGAGFLAEGALAYGLFITGRVREAADALRAATPIEPSWRWPLIAIHRLALRSMTEDRLGHAEAATTAAEEALTLVEECGVGEAPSVAIAYTAAGKSLARRGELAEAEALLERATRMRKLPPGNLGHVHTSLELARIRARRGDREGAVSILDWARSVMTASADPGMLPTLADEVERELGPRAAVAPPSDELSVAELRVLRLLPTRMTQREIARELYLSLNTVKTHVRVIRKKLGVSSRAEAVAAARTRRLL